MACKLDNWKVVDELKKGLGTNNDLLVQLNYAELKCRQVRHLFRLIIQFFFFIKNLKNHLTTFQLKKLGEIDHVPHRQTFIATEMSPLLTQAYNVYAEMDMVRYSCTVSSHD